MSTLTIRIENELKDAAASTAKKMGVSLSFVIKNALRNFINNPKITISEPEELKVTKAIQKKMDQVAEALNN